MAAKGPVANSPLLLATAPAKKARTKRCLSPRVFSAVCRRGLRWSVEREPNHTFRPANEIINEPLIWGLLENTKEAARDEKKVQAILDKALDHALLKQFTDSGIPGEEFVQGLTLEETATLLNVDSSNTPIMNQLFDTALKIKKQIYGNRIVLFAPLYLSNYCVNTCTYCAFRGANTHIQRSFLTDDQLRDEVAALQRQGHRRLLVLTGEHPKYSFDAFLKAIDTIASVRTDPSGCIRRINVEIPPLSVSDMRRLKATDKVGTFTLFQETYHRETYARVHPGGAKSDFEHRLLTHDRAQIAGLDDVGIGALFGLFDYRFEVMGLLSHAMHLDHTYGAGPHTISIPRLRPADHAPDAEAPPAPVSDEDFKKLVAIIRCAVPYTGMILSTRESPAMRRELLQLGVSQMSAGSKTDVGSYSEQTPRGEFAHHSGFSKKPETVKDAKGKEKVAAGQFTLLDERSTDEVVADLMTQGFLPSWCTACYRKGRTGEAFMKIAKKGDIQNFCHPNSLLTLQEYLQDYASPESRKVGEELIAREIETIPSERARKKLHQKMEKVAAGERDLFF